MLIVPPWRVARRDWCRRATAFCALLIAVGCSGSSSSPTQTQAQGQHVLSIDGAILNGNVLNLPYSITEAQLVVDGVAVADQQYPSGVDGVPFSYTATFSTGGIHQVGLRLVKSRYGAQGYFTSGGATGIYGSTSVTVNFPNDTRTLAAGDQIALLINVP
jgi:hypothetical protein